MDRLSGYGISIDVPPGWEAELSLQEDPSMVDTDLVLPDEQMVVLHMANFWMPPDRSDYGWEAVQAMGSGGIFIALVEFDSTATGSSLFEHIGIPVQLKPNHFSPAQLQQPMRGQAGLQRFFCSGSRAFCLHAVIGSYGLRQALTPDVNGLLSGLTIE